MSFHRFNFKEQIKKVLYLLAMSIVIALLVLVGTGIIQVGILFLSNQLQIDISEDLLYHISGNGGTAIAAILCAIYVKKKNYIQNIGTTTKFTVKHALYYMGLALCICHIITDVVTTLVFAHLFPLAEEQTMTGTTYMDILFAIILAPIAEELLFRMGIYSLLRKKFARISSIIICAVLFAVIHGYQIQGFISCLVAGLVFTLIYDRTRNIIYCIGAHMICNLFATVMNELEYRQVTWLGVPLQYEINGYVMLHPVFIIIGVLGVLFCACKTTGDV